MGELNVSFLTDIEKYLKDCKTRCSLTQFVDLNKKDTKIYIHQFDTETQARKSLEIKYTGAFKTVFPNRKRITIKSIDIGILYAEARAERKTLMEGYKTLEAGISEARRALLNNLNANTNESRSEVDGVDDADKENEEDIDDDHDYASNGYNIKQRL
ncbi:hypothetical protein INT46_005847 [Mucor plumbeus]|uniref:Uncharacterized protein n=1 Tax=Mucor plumbeus TaxID=97098 RepID=A0A8H7RC07_9FUNG|nr:hypothetical protein INT46_005847 [Mucor plumbeus]